MNKTDYINHLRSLEADVEKAEMLRLQALEFDLKKYEAVLHDLIHREACYQQALSELKESCEKQISHLTGLQERFRLRMDWLTRGAGAAWGLHRGKGWLSVITSGLVVVVLACLLSVFLLILVPVWVLFLLVFRFVYKNPLEVLQDAHGLLLEMPGAIEVTDLERSVPVLEARNYSALAVLEKFDLTLAKNESVKKYRGELILRSAELGRCLR